ncbi:MAG: cytochrome c maturation protein CcmE [Rhodothermales bacterium]|nr:cytochrome c maturation protein CcmE [Rhodothermales bacterium]MCA0268717.1 cytochrome c maturation protein CcmE [Bacteroidota bacterium]
MKPKALAGLALIAVFAFLLFRSFGQQVGGYMDFAEAQRTDTEAHVVGTWVKDQPVSYDPASNVFSFVMQDEQGEKRTVRYHNPKPANFEQAQQVVVMGKADGDAFTASHILVKCPSKYNDGREYGDPAQHPEGVPMTAPPART